MQSAFRKRHNVIYLMSRRTVSVYLIDLFRISIRRKYFVLFCTISTLTNRIRFVQVFLRYCSTKAAASRRTKNGISCFYPAMFTRVWKNLFSTLQTPLLLYDAEQEREQNFAFLVSVPQCKQLFIMLFILIVLRHGLWIEK